jgi:hypothetical protein
MQYSTQSFPARYISGSANHFVARLLQLVIKSLMDSLLMIMSQE